MNFEEIKEEIMYVNGCDEEEAENIFEDLMWFDDEMENELYEEI